MRPDTSGIVTARWAVPGRASHLVSEACVQTMARRTPEAVNGRQECRSTAAVGHGNKLEGEGARFSGKRRSCATDTRPERCENLFRPESDRGRRCPGKRAVKRPIPKLPTVFPCWPTPFFSMPADAVRLLAMWPSRRPTPSAHIESAETAAVFPMAVPEMMWTREIIHHGGTDLDLEHPSAGGALDRGGMPPPGHLPARRRGPGRRCLRLRRDPPV
jgi:hypothetical protein